ncbi:MAG TPA: SatD family protein [Solirubrobacterales bacterium]
MNARSQVALIGDLIASRQAENRLDLQNELRRALKRVNWTVKALQPLETTVGDEFQGVYKDAASAVRASLLLRLELLKEAEVDSRYGIGCGSLTVFEDKEPLSQDGPAWWAARSAIDRTREQAGEGRTDFVRTWFVESEAEAEPPLGARALNTSLMLRDALIAQMRPRSRRLLLGLLRERSQADLAADEGISQSAVSQNLSASGAYAVRAAELELSGLR